MKILYSRTHFWFGLKAGGSVGHTAGVLTGFSQLANVEVISNESLYGADGLPCELVPPRGVRRSWLGELFYNFYFAPKLAAKIAAFQPDFVYHRYNGFSFATARVCRRLGVPLVLEFNSSNIWTLPNWAGNSLKNRLSLPIKKLIVRYSEPFNLHAASLIVVVSKPLQEDLVARGIPNARILVNPNGVDTEKFTPIASEAVCQLRQGLKMPCDKIVVGFIGTFGPWHGTEVLAEAFGRLIQQYPTYREQILLLMIGDGVYMPRVKEILDKYQAVDATMLTGLIPHEQAPKYLASCDILVSPQIPNPDGTPFFGSPTKLFEYMAMGKGIIASDLDQIGEVLNHNHTAWLVEPGDVESLMHGLKILIDDQSIRARLGYAARVDVVANYTWRKHTDRVIEKLKELCG